MNFLKDVTFGGEVFDNIETAIGGFNSVCWVALSPNAITTPYDPVTDTGGENAYLILAKGDQEKPDGRIQQVSLNRDREGAYNPTSEVYYRLSVKDVHSGGTSFNFPKNTLIRLSKVSRNKRLLDYMFTVVESTNSDFIQQVDVLLRVDMEDRPNYPEIESVP